MFEINELYGEAFMVILQNTILLLQRRMIAFEIIIGKVHILHAYNHI